MTDIKNLHQVINLSQREAIILALQTTSKNMRMIVDEIPEIGEKLKGLLAVNAEANDKLVAALTAEAPKQFGGWSGLVPIKGEGLPYPEDLPMAVAPPQIDEDCARELQELFIRMEHAAYCVGKHDGLGPPSMQPDKFKEWHDEMVLLTQGKARVQEEFKSVINGRRGK